MYNQSVSIPTFEPVGFAHTFDSLITRVGPRLTYAILFVPLLRRGILRLPGYCPPLLYYSCPSRSGYPIPTAVLCGLFEIIGRLGRLCNAYDVQDI